MSSACRICGKDLKDVSGNAGVTCCADCEPKVDTEVKQKMHADAATSSSVHRQPKQSEPVTSGIGQAISDKPRLGPYVILAEVGRGGMGRVYKAMHRTLRQIRALKVLNKDESRNPKVVARFQREARIVAKLDHPHVVRIFEFEKDPEKGLYYIVMEYVDGGSVSRILRRQGKLPWQQTVEILLQVARGLSEMHRLGLVHRDIKPSNILIDKAGTAKLADLGLARHQGDGGDTQLTATGAVMGTIDYMAPEQIVDVRHADVRSDLYALGCSLFHMLAGRVPYPEGSSYQKIQQQIHEPLPEVGPLAPDVPFQLVLILNRLTEKDPANRYQTPAELIGDLEALEGEAAPCEVGQDSTILQLQALAEAAAKDRGTTSGPGSTRGSSRSISVTISALPAWALISTGVVIGLFILGTLWMVVNAIEHGKL
jgi:serine/threonine protein kinase